jgi:TPR repeat protein
MGGGTRTLRKKHGEPYSSQAALGISFICWALNWGFMFVLFAIDTDGKATGYPGLGSFLLWWWAYANLREKYLHNCFKATGTPSERAFFANILGISYTMSRDEVIQCYISKKKSALTPMARQNVELAYTFFIEPKKYGKLAKKGAIPFIETTNSSKQEFSSQTSPSPKSVSVAIDSIQSSKTSSESLKTKSQDINAKVPATSSTILEIAPTAMDTANEDSSESQTESSNSENIVEDNIIQCSDKTKNELSDINDKSFGEIPYKQDEKIETSNIQNSSFALNNKDITSSILLQSKKDKNKQLLNNEGIILLIICIVIICICLISFFDNQTQQFEVENYEELVFQAENFIKKKYKTPMAKQLANDELKRIINNDSLIKIEKINLIHTNILKNYNQDNNSSFEHKYPQLVEKAKKLFQQGEDAYYGNGREKNINEAFFLLNNAAELGNSEAQAMLGIYYFNLPKDDKWINSNYDKGYHWVYKSAIQGNALGQRLLGVCYLFGWGIKVDYNEAFKWAMKAAEQNEATAQCLIGDCYLNGWGTECNRKEAEYWFRKSANNNYNDAKERLLKHFQQ